MLKELLKWMNWFYYASCDVEKYLHDQIETHRCEGIP